MVTTSRLVSLDVVRSEGTDLIHPTGWLQVVARAARGGPPYWAKGIHQSRHPSGEFAAPLDVWARFALRGSTPDGPPITCLTLAVRFRVTVPADRRVTVGAAEVELLPDASEMFRCHTNAPGLRDRPGAFSRR
jgi:hypothetical protein